MSTENGKQAAFPMLKSLEQKTKDTVFEYGMDGGLTKREYFAAMALQGILANPAPEIFQSEVPLEKMAVTLADALLHQLNQNK